jgi:hypothetical protein
MQGVHFREKVNAEMARKLNMPVFFAVSASARLDLPTTIDVSGRLTAAQGQRASNARDRELWPRS